MYDATINFCEWDGYSVKCPNCININMTYIHSVNYEEGYDLPVYKCPICRIEVEVDE